jgi:hypothetical protein
MITKLLSQYLYPVPRRSCAVIRCPSGVLDQTSPDHHVEVSVLLQYWNSNYSGSSHFGLNPGLLRLPLCRRMLYLESGQIWTVCELVRRIGRR